MKRTADHFAGCLLGGAVGDALGAPVEFMSLERIRAAFGPGGVTDYAEAYGRRGAITDDTQMTMFTAEGLLRACCQRSLHGVLNFAVVVHHAYLRWLGTQGQTSSCQDILSVEGGWLMEVRALHARRAPGNTCISALRARRMGTMDQPLNNSKGCGGVMRMAPVGLFFDDPEEAFAMGCEFAAITHGHPSGYLAAGCFAAIISHIMAGVGLSDAVHRTMALLQAKSGCGECVAALNRAMAQASRTEPSAQMVETLGAGWVAEEALAIAVYCSLAANGDFRRGVLLAVNHSGDSDSTGAITGNILGALSGKTAIPADWLDGLELRAETEELADDLFVRFRDDQEWWARYPGY